MTPSAARKLIEKISKMTEKAFRVCNGIEPVFHFEGDQGITSVIIPIQYPPDTKDMVSDVIRSMLAKDNAVWVMMVSEAWSIEGSGDMEIPASLEHVPGRKEIIIYQFEDKDIPQMSAEQEIIRPEGKNPYLGELIIRESFKSSEGRFVGMLPRGKMSS